MRAVRTRWVERTTVLLVLAVLLPSCETRPVERVREVEWSEGSVHGRWRTQYNGAGSVTARGDSVILAPLPARHEDETHAALVLSTASYSDFTYRLTMRTRAQVRRSGPNPWETAWAVWHYRDDSHFYYFTLKTNGWELGKVAPECAETQCFLATGDGTPHPVDSWHRIEVRQTGPTMTIEVDSEPLTTYTDRHGPYTNGSVGLYTEDAVAEFKDIVIEEAGSGE